MSGRLAELSIAAPAQRQVQIETKYAVYIRRQASMIERLQRTGALPIPDSFDFSAVPQLRREAQDKLGQIRPHNLGQAGRVSGITPADLAVLLMYLNEPERMIS